MLALVLGPLEPSSKAFALLEACGLHPERVDQFPRGYGPEWLEHELGCPPLQEGEHRWAFLPSRMPEVTVSAIPVGEVWHVELRRPRESLWYACHLEPWPGNRRTVLHAADGTVSVRRPPLAPPPLPRGRPLIDVERAVASPVASAEATKALARMREAPPGPPRGVVLDGMRVVLRWMTDGAEAGLATQSLRRDDQRGRSLIHAGLTLANTAATSSAVRSAVVDLAHG